MRVAELKQLSGNDNNYWNDCYKSFKKIVNQQIVNQMSLRTIIQYEHALSQIVKLNRDDNSRSIWKQIVELCTSNGDDGDYGDDGDDGDDADDGEYGDTIINEEGSTAESEYLFVVPTNLNINRHRERKERFLWTESFKEYAAKLHLTKGYYIDYNDGEDGENGDYGDEIYSSVDDGNNL